MQAISRASYASAVDATIGASSLQDVTNGFC